MFFRLNIKSNDILLVSNFLKRISVCCRLLPTGWWPMYTTLCLMSPHRALTPFTSARRTAHRCRDSCRPSGMLPGIYGHFFTYTILKCPKLNPCITPATFSVMLSQTLLKSISLNDIKKFMLSAALFLYEILYYQVNTEFFLYYFAKNPLILLFNLIPAHKLVSTRHTIHSLTSRCCRESTWQTAMWRSSSAPLKW